ncbi:MAG: hypothetical protein PF518_19460, partial [Spirochaetaceae bacterium]|nr:hypothetical protein [Spirochaetaceae bacterium]
MDKKTIRKEIYKYFDALSDKTLRDLSLETSWILVSQKQWSEAGTILLFLTFGKVFQTEFLIKHDFKSIKKVAVHRIYG